MLASKSLSNTVWVVTSWKTGVNIINSHILSVHKTKGGAITKATSKVEKYNSSHEKTSKMLLISSYPHWYGMGQRGAYCVNEHEIIDDGNGCETDAVWISSLLKKNHITCCYIYNSKPSKILLEVYSGEVYDQIFVSEYKLEE